MRHNLLERIIYAHNQLWYIFALRILGLVLMGRMRPYRIEICLNEQEYFRLKKQMAVSGLSCAALVRDYIMGKEIKPRPPEEWPELVRQVSAFGNNLNQIARVANSSQTISQETLREVMRMQAAIWEKVKGL